MHRRLLEIPLPFHGYLPVYSYGVMLVVGFLAAIALARRRARQLGIDPEIMTDMGVRAMIGKGGRSADVINAMKAIGAVYLAATGGAGALLGRCITASEIIAYEDLGPEAVRRMEVKDFPAIVAIDAEGNSLYKR